MAAIDGELFRDFGGDSVRQQRLTCSLAFSIEELSMNVKRFTQSDPEVELKKLLEIRGLASNTALPAITWPRIPPPPAPPPAATQTARGPTPPANAKNY
jgi:hypothetical protein